MPAPIIIPIPPPPIVPMAGLYAASQNASDHKYVVVLSIILICLMIPAVIHMLLNVIYIDNPPSWLKHINKKIDKLLRLE